MRALTRALSRTVMALAFAVPAGAVLAQVQQNDPNAANASLARQGEIRALNQSRVSDFNTLSMQAQRNVQYRAYEPAYGLPRGIRRGRAHRSGGLDTGVCVGC